MDICEQCGMPALVLYTGYCKQCDMEEHERWAEYRDEEKNNERWDEEKARLEAEEDDRCVECHEPSTIMTPKIDSFNTWYANHKYVELINKALGLKETLGSLKYTIPF